MDDVRRRVVVSGEVQGVSFRAATREEASRRGVAGSVENRSDGAVEAVFEGQPEAVEAMVEWCRSGPSSASVQGVDASDESPEGITGFEER